MKMYLEDEKDYIMRMINEAENRILEEHDYSVEEVLDGIRQAADRSGFRDVIGLFVEEQSEEE